MASSDEEGQRVRRSAQAGAFRAQRCFAPSSQPSPRGRRREAKSKCPLLVEREAVAGEEICAGGCFRSAALLRPLIPTFSPGEKELQPSANTSPGGEGGGSG
jgi:hypothetical protein